MTDNKSTYQRHPDLHHYVTRERYENPKEDFKTIGNKLAELCDPSRRLELADIGTGNGELLYYLHKRFPDWQLNGFDHTAEFVATARSFAGLEGVNIQQADLFDIEGRFDVVTTVCFLSLFPDIEKPLEKLLALCNTGGYVLATGLFNPFDIEVRVQFCDNSREETRDQWSTDFNRHSQRRIREMLAGRVESVEFEECKYDVNIPRDPDHPIRVWSDRDEHGRTLLINGAWQIANQTLMIIHK